MPGQSSFVSSARITSLFTLGSRLAGLGREILFSYFFSTGELLSAFRIAFVIPNLARRLFGEGALSAAVVPVLTRSLRENGEDSSKNLVGSLLAVLAVILGSLTLLAELMVLVWRLIQDDPAIRLTAFTLPYMPMICAVALLSGVLNVRGSFAAPAAAPILFNLIVIGATLVASFGAGLEGTALMDVLCLSVLAGGVAQLVLVTLALHRTGFFPRWGEGLRHPQVRAVFLLMAPMFLGLSAVQVNTFLDSIIAYLFIVVDGERVGPAVLGYAQFLYQFPLGVFGIGLATAIFPHLSAKAADGDRLGLADAFQRGLRLSLFVALPAAVGLAFVARPLIAALYQRNEFTSEDTERVAGALICYSLGLAAYFAQHVVIRTYYALHDSKTPARIALYMVVANLGLNLVLVFPLQERGLALSTALTAYMQLLWLSVRLKRLAPEVQWRPVAASLIRSLVASTMMAAALALWHWGVVRQTWLAESDIFNLICMVGLGVGVYWLSTRWFRCEELDWLVHRGPGAGPQLAAEI